MEYNAVAHLYLKNGLVRRRSAQLCRLGAGSPSNLSEITSQLDQTGAGNSSVAIYWTDLHFISLIILNLGATKITRTRLIKEKNTNQINILSFLWVAKDSAEPRVMHYLYRPPHSSKEGRMVEQMRISLLWGCHCKEWWQISFFPSPKQGQLKEQT